MIAIKLQWSAMTLMVSMGKPHEFVSALPLDYGYECKTAPVAHKNEVKCSAGHIILCYRTVKDSSVQLGIKSYLFFRES